MKYLMIFLLTLSCQEKVAKLNAVMEFPPVVDKTQKVITFSDNSPGLARIEVSTATVKGDFVSVIAPGRVVSTIAQNIDRDPEVYFGSPELNDLYFEYAQRLSTKITNEKNYERLKDMYAQQAATQKELREGERDLNNSKYASNESENKLRAQGVQPELLKKATEDFVLVACDVPENQLFHVEDNEDVDLYFNSFGDEKFVGKVIALGNVIDPVSRTLRVTVKLKNQTKKIKAGMFAKIEFGDYRHDLITVPVNAVITLEGKSYVFVTTNGKTFVMRSVGTAAYGNQTVGILTGLKSGEKIVSRGALLLKALIKGN